METIYYVMAAVGMAFGVSGFVFAIVCLGKVKQLAAQLEKKGLLDGNV